MTRRLSVLVLVAVLATAATSALLIARERARTEPEVTPPSPSGLVLLVVRTDGGSLPVVVGSTGFGTSGALVVPTAAQLVIPGQGESSVREALELPSRQAATKVHGLVIKDAQCVNKTYPQFFDDLRKVLASHGQ